MANKVSEKSPVVVETQVGNATISFETGWIAKQAAGAVVVRAGDTVVLATVCTMPTAQERDFFPLTVEYQEKAYAAGKIPGGFFKREGKPAETEILTARLIDRPIRPLFHDDFKDEVQVVCTVMSADGVNSPDVLAICAAGAALEISPLPFLGPIAGVRVGRIGGKFVANPSRADLEKSDIDLVVVGSRDAIVMVEGGADMVPENEVLDALYFGHSELQKIIAITDELRAKAGKPKLEVKPVEKNTALESKIDALVKGRLEAALAIRAKQERNNALSAVVTEVKAALAEEFPEQEKAIGEILHERTRTILREEILSKGVRVDGRGLKDVRPISCEAGIVPRAHGSALFTRGETQAVVTTTLGTSMDAQMIDDLAGPSEKTFMLHYNFPPYATGEVKMMRGTGRREVGHGNLAERSLRRVLPKGDDFPYVVRIVSDITESNGSSSMATVCGGSLSLMDAGVKTKAAVGGVAMGLIKEGDRVAILTDILGDEDHFGDMDFKVAGSRTGVTGLQMDIKCKGLSRDTMSKALEQARVGRLHIIDQMDKALTTARDAMSQYAPQIYTLKINPDKIRDVIGPGGKTIRSITETTGVKIDIDDNGTVKIASADQPSAQRAIEIIRGLTEEAEIGKVYLGVVKRIADFGAFVEILPGCEGLVHISQLSTERVNEVTDVVREGDEVMVRVLDIDRQGRIRLSRKEALDAEKPERRF